MGFQLCEHNGADFAADWYRHKKVQDVLQLCDHNGADFAAD